MRVARALTVKEIAAFYEVPEGTVRWLANRDHWERTEDGRRPVMYLRANVATTFEKRDETSSLTA